MTSYQLAKVKAILLGSVTAIAAAAPISAQAQNPEIVVQAQRRSERLVDVPISITAVSADELENAGIENTTDLALLVPGLRMDASGNYSPPTIRGVTTTLTSLNEANVATYIDGVYQPFIQNAVYGLPDVQQIEVLKGPQGTLFGRNATGGAILIHTKAPDLNEVTGEVTAGTASFDTWKADGFVSVPLIQDRLAISLTGMWEESDGFLKNVITGQTEGGYEKYLLRGKVLFEPSDGARFTLSAIYSDSEDYAILRRTTYQGNNALALSGAYTGPYADEPFETSHSPDVNPLTAEEKFSVSLRGEIDAGPGTLTTTTAYVRDEGMLVTDSDETPPVNGRVLSQEQVLKSWSQELLYTTEQLGRFRAVAGFFYFDRRGAVDPFLFHIGPILALADRNGDKSRTWAVFGEATYDLTDSIHLTAGLRYSEERIRTFKDANNTGVFPSERTPFASDTFDSLDPRLVLAVDLGPNTNVYASYSTAFKSGTFNLSGSSTQRTSVRPEKIDAFEIGLKSSDIDRLAISLAGFYYDYKDLQVTAYENDAATGALRQFLTNAASAEIYGVEANLAWRVNEEFDLNVGGTYLDAEYSSFPGATSTVPRTSLPGGTCDPTVNASVNAPLCTSIFDASGNRLIRTPKFSAFVSASYTKEFAAGTLSLNGVLYHSSKIFYEVGNRIFQPSYEELNLSASFSPADTPLTLRVYGRNLTNETVIAAALATASYDAVTYRAPRSYGIEAKLAF